MVLSTSKKAATTRAPPASSPSAPRSVLVVACTFPTLCVLGSRCARHPSRPVLPRRLPPVRRGAARRPRRVRPRGDGLAGGRRRRRPRAAGALRRIRAGRRGRRHGPGLLADRPLPGARGARRLTGDDDGGRRAGRRPPSGKCRSRAGRGEGDQAATAEISRVMRTLSPTSTPPVSRAAFQVRPKSLREISVLAEKPTRSAPNGSVAEPLYSTARAAGRVTPLMVRSPWTVNSGSEPSTRVLVKVQVGLFSASQKSALRRWLSRFSSRVSTEADWMVALTCEAAKFAATTPSPEYSVIWPRTLETPAWRTVKPTSEWPGSML